MFYVQVVRKSRTEVIKSRKGEAHFSGRWLSDAYSPHPGRLLGIPGCLWESPGYLLDAQEEKREGGGRS